MIRKPVLSSRISSVGRENNTLEVEFKNGAVYKYFNVSESEYKRFINSESLGSALTKLDKIHHYQRVH